MSLILATDEPLTPWQEMSIEGGKCRLKFLLRRCRRKSGPRPAMITAALQEKEPQSGLFTCPPPNILATQQRL